MDNEATVFVSFGREDLDFAQRLSGDLRQAGLSPWLYHERLKPGDDWRESTRRAIQDSDYFVVLLSSRSVNRKGYMHWELYEALDQLTLFPLGQIYLVPVRLDDCEAVHARLANLHWVDLFPDWDEGLTKLKTAFRRESDSPKAQRPELIADAPNASYLQLSDVQAIPDPSTKTCMLDFRVVNTGASEVLINRVKLIVDEVLPGCQMLSPMAFSEIYDLDISSLKRPGDTISVGIAQILRPGEVDRFGVRVIATRIGMGVFRGWRLRVSLETTAGPTDERRVEVWLPYRLP